MIQSRIHEIIPELLISQNLNLTIGRSKIMSDQSFLDEYFNSSPPSTASPLSMPSWGGHQILSFGGASQNFVSVIKYFLFFFEKLMQK